MAQVKFYRGVIENSLSNIPIRDGSIYIIDKNENPSGTTDLGEMYVDIGERRLQISAQDSTVNLEIFTETEWDQISNTIVSTFGKIYLEIEDPDPENPNKKQEELGFKIGDGSAFVVDLPFNSFYTDEDKTILNALKERSLDVEVELKDGETTDYNLAFSKGFSLS